MNLRTRPFVRPPKKGVPQCPSDSTRARTGVIAVGAALALGLAGCRSGTPSSSNGGAEGAPTDGTLTVGLLGDIGQPPDPRHLLRQQRHRDHGRRLRNWSVQQQHRQSRDRPNWREVGSQRHHDVYTFHLRQGVKFHDGTPFTSATVDVALKRRIRVKGGAAYMVEAVKASPPPITTPRSSRSTGPTPRS